LFMAVFFGTAALGAVLGITAALRWGEPGMPALLAGSVLYLAGVLLGTLRGNVPLNKELAAANPGGASGADTWVRYLRRWGRWNHLRTLAAALACAAFIGALAPLGPGW
ncbi:MAG TPA: anthrone oxygenase family protein, partial [Kiloniellales bacterium]